jgi:hypothetical protein
VGHDPTDPGELRNLWNVPERQSLAASMLSRMIGFDRDILESRPDRYTCA